MSARLTSTMFVSALLRRVQGEGGFGTVIARGFEAAGAIHVEWRHRGEVGLLSPAPFTMEPVGGWPADGMEGERRFTPAPAATEAEIAERMAAERRFDPEAWHVEIEGVDPRTVLDVVG